jgi:hypothetical protein
MRIQLSPLAAIGISVSLLIALTTCTTVTALNGHGISLDENQILYLFSTSAEVIAAIYGLTLTGFIFFRNELSREEFEDETLVETIESLKRRYFALLLFIAGLVTLTLLLANLAIVHEGSGEARLNTLIINAGQSAFVTSLVVIVYFIFDVIAPKRIEGASKRLQRTVDAQVVEGQNNGSLEEFLKNYNQIEALLDTAGKRYQEISPNAKERRYQRRLPNSRLAEILVRNNRIDKQLFHSLQRLITLRNSIIHGADPVVSRTAVESSVDVLNRLTKAVKEDL